MIKMPDIRQTLIVVLLLQISKAAPGDLLTKLENIAKINEDVKLDSEPNVLLKEANKDNDNSTETQGQRQKRYFNYGFPPINPGIYPNPYPNFPSRDFPVDYDQEDAFQQIYRRLQNIASVVRQPSLPPPPPPNQFPFYYPVFYIPPVGCACTPNQYVPPNQNVPTNPVTPSPIDKDNSSDVDISNRFPEMEDTRQNWGLVVNETEEDDGQEEDFTRPISFVPIRPNRTMTRPPPPVDNGSTQGGSQSQTPTTTTIRPMTNNPERPASPPNEAPSPCDAAVLSCCHQPEVTYDCFAVQGCPDPSIYGNPCDIQVILRVIDRFQRFYGQRFG